MKNMHIYITCMVVYKKYFHGYVSYTVYSNIPCGVISYLLEVVEQKSLASTHRILVTILVESRFWVILE